MPDKFDAYREALGEWRPPPIWPEEYELDPLPAGRAGGPAARIPRSGGPFGIRAYPHRFLPHYIHVTDEDYERVAS